LTWGNPLYGGKIPEHIQPLLQNIEEIVATEKAFAALSRDGQVFAWGDPNYGGFIPEEIQVQLYNVNLLDVNTEGTKFVAFFRDGRGQGLHWP
jgi:hypothetical protein